MVVGGRHTGGRYFHSRLPCSGACQRANALKRTSKPAHRDTAHPGSGCPSSGALLAVARAFSLGGLSLAAGRKSAKPTDTEGAFNACLDNSGGRCACDLSGPLGTPDGAAALGWRLFHLGEPPSPCGPRIGENA